MQNPIIWERYGAARVTADEFCKRSEGENTSPSAGFFLTIHVKLRKLIGRKLTLDWLPEQVSGRLKIPQPADESMRVSHETIYRNPASSLRYYAAAVDE